MRGIYIKKRNLPIAFILVLTFLKTLGFDMNDQVFIVSAVIMTTYLGISFFVSEWSKKQFNAFFLLLIIASLTLVFSKRVTAVVIIITIFSICYIEDSEKVIELVAKLWLYMVVIKVILAFLGVIDMQPQVQWGPNGIIGTAYGFGFGNKNQFGIAILNFFISYIYLYFEKTSIKKLVVLSCGCIYLAQVYAQSSTSVLLIVTLMGFVVFSKKFTNFNIKIIARFILPLMALLSFVLPLFYGIFGAFTVLNQLLSTRLNLSWFYLSTYPISLFGNSLDILSIALDNAYLTLYCGFGVIFFVSFLFLYQKTINWMISKNFQKELCITCAYLLMGYTEGAFINPFINFSIMFIGLYLKERYDY